MLTVGWRRCLVWRFEVDVRVQSGSFRVELKYGCIVLQHLNKRKKYSESGFAGVLMSNLACPSESLGWVPTILYGLS